MVDSMQVYREIPTITNQARGRRAELVGIVSVVEEWTVAHHRRRARAIAEAAGGPFVLDAGTGMYLNAILLDLPMTPKVGPELRRRAEREISSRDDGAKNPRRAARARELELAGTPPRASIWSGDLLYDTTLLYLRPDRVALDAAIARRSKRLATEGLDEAATIKAMIATGHEINPSVTESVGMRELTRCLEGELTPAQAEDLMATRTRRLARRQMRWFDKLVTTLEGRARVNVLENVTPDSLHSMHDIMMV